MPSPVLQIDAAQAPVKANPAPKSTRFDYSWVNVVLAAVLMLATLPGRTQGLGLITEPLLKDLHLERLAYADLNLWATLLGAVFCFPAGYFIDRFGLRMVSTVLVLSLGITVWKMSVFAGGIAGLFILILLTRALGQSALSVASITTVGKTTGRRLGLRMGTYSFLLSILFVFAFVVVGRSVSDHGWRTAWRQIAVALLFVIAPLTLVFLRENGRAAAGDVEKAASVVEADIVPPSLTLVQTLHTLAFWTFGLSAALFNLVASGLGLFNEAVLAEHGFDQNAFHHFLAATTAAALCGQLLCGWLAQRHPLTRLMGLGLLLYAAALGMLPFIKSFAHLWVFAGLIGIAGGFITVIFFAIWRQAFGPAHLGRIQGAAQLLTVVSSAVGPVLFAKCAAVTGSYTPLVLGLSVVVLAMGVTAWNTALPKLAQIPAGPAAAAPDRSAP